MTVSPLRKTAHCTLVVGALSAALLLHDNMSAHAQTVLETVTLYREPSIRPGSQINPDIVSSIQVQENARPPSELRYLPATHQSNRMAGELSALEWPITLTASDARETRRFRVSYKSAASVLPDVSSLSLRINGVAVGASTIAAPGDVRPIEFDIARNVLREGLNTVTLTAEQRHRVDCSVDATYELWTDIDVSRTGFVTTTAQQPSKLADLAALRFRADGALVIRVRVEGPMSPARVDHTIRAAQAIALIGSYQNVVVSLTRDDDADFGINLVVGDATMQPRLVADGGPSLAATDGAGLLMQTMRAGVAPTLVAAGASDADVAKAVSELLNLASTAVRSMPSRRTELTGDETRSLADFGKSGISFSGRFARIPIDFTMPADFLAADYGKLALNLTGSTAAGLSADAQLQVRLNGRDAASVALARAAGGAFHHRGIAVPLSALRPGENTIEIAARLPSQSDQACGGSASLDDAANRFTLSAASDIQVPPLARIGQLPNLAQTMAGGFPFSIPGSRPKLYVPTPDRDAIAAAMTLAVQLSVVAHRAIPFETMISNPVAASGHGLLVAPARALNPDLMRHIGIDPDAVRKIWEKRTDAPIVSSADDGYRAVVASNAPPPATPRLTWPKMVTQASATIRGWMGHPASLSQDDINPAAGLIVAQGFQSDDSQDAIMVVTAPNSAALRSGVEALATPSKWSGLRGRLTMMDQSADVLDTIGASRVRFVATQPSSLGNTRLIVAGWLSIHPAIYTLSALVLAAVLAFATRLLVKNVGRRNTP